MEDRDNICGQLRDWPGETVRVVIDVLEVCQQVIEEQRELSLQAYVSGDPEEVFSTALSEMVNVLQPVINRAAVCEGVLFFYARLLAGLEEGDED